MAFNGLKEAICNAPILAYPDWSQDFILTTDASKMAVGAILSQGRIGYDRPISFSSRTLNKAEQNYSTSEKELLAIVWAVKNYRQYLYGRKFKIVTDHKPLTYLMNVKDPSSRLMRWRLKLLEYDYEIVYKKGSANTNADALSRINVLKTDEIDKLLESEPDSLEIENITNELDRLNESTKRTRELKLMLSKLNVEEGYVNVGSNPDRSEWEEQLAPILDKNYHWIVKIKGYLNPNNKFQTGYIQRTIASFNPATELIFEPLPKRVPGKKSEFKPRGSTRPSSAPPTSTYIPTQSEVPVPLSPDPSIPSTSALPRIIKSITIRKSVGKRTNPTILFTNQPPPWSEEKSLYLAPSATFHQQAIALKSFLQDCWTEINFISDENRDGLITRLLDEVWAGGNLKVYISEPIQEPLDKQEIIRKAHDSLFGGHYALDKTLQKIRQKFDWPNITVDVKEYIKNCRICQENKDTTRQPYLYSNPDIPYKPNDKISIDILGPLAETNASNKYILVIQDYLSRYLMTETLKDKSTASIIKAIWYSWIRIFGRPKEILSDNALEFTSQEFEDFCRLIKTKHVLTSVYHPQSNGKNERSHLILKEFLRHYTIDNEWDTVLPQAMLSYNCTINRSTGYTPFELHFGREPNIIF